MNYTLEIVDISNPEIELKLRELYKAAFNNPELLPKGYLYKNTNTNANLPTYFIAAVDKENIVGCSAFIPFDFTIGKVAHIGCQVGWSATLPNYQGQRIFVNTINYAKEYLKNKGATFLFATSNHTSHPIFIHKLGFRVIPNALLKIPNLPFVKDSYFRNSDLERLDQMAKETAFPDEEQIITWKQQENRGEIEVVRHGESFAWGKVIIRKKVGIRFPYFYIGGIHLVNAADAKTIIYKIFSQYRVYYIQLVSIESNPFNQLFSGWKKNEMSGCIFFDLTEESFQNFNMMYGIVDTF